MHERFYRINQLLANRRVVPTATFLEELDVSLATFKRDITYMRDRLHAPIEFDRELGGYRLGKAGVGPAYHLPGLWFDGQQTRALLTMKTLLQQLDPGGWLADEVQPLLSQVETLLDTPDTAHQGYPRLRILRGAHRPTDPKHFSTVAFAVLRRRPLSLSFLVPGDSEPTSQRVSPQRLVMYRDNWYLDVWVDAIARIRRHDLHALMDATIEQGECQDISESELDAVLGRGYGMVTDTDARITLAVLLFRGESTRRVSTEIWHPLQQGEWLANQVYKLTLPVLDERELLADILRHGADIEVLEPPALRNRVQTMLSDAQGIYALSATKTGTADADLKAAIRQAANWIAGADALLILAGAGMSVDSGLPDYRGPKGLWANYPILVRRQLDPQVLARPDAFRSMPRVAWGFYGHRLRRYRLSQPHEGHRLLSKWSEACRHGAHVLTTNVDGLFQRAGFDAKRVAEANGSLHYLQCLDNCQGEVWRDANWSPEVDETICELVNELPRCPDCGGIARPNVLMFADWNWVGDRAATQQARLEGWLAETSNLVVIEIGAGTVVDTLRRYTSRLQANQEIKVVRINPADALLLDDRSVVLTGTASTMLSAIQRAMSPYKSSP